MSTTIRVKCDGPGCRREEEFGQGSHEVRDIHQLRILINDQYIRSLELCGTCEKDFRSFVLSFGKKT